MKRLLSMFTLATMIAMLLCCFSVPANAATLANGNVKGDVNGDGCVDNLDAATILKFDAALIDFSTEQIILGDFNEDGKVDNLDAASILKYDSGYDFSVTRQFATDVPMSFDGDKISGELKIPSVVLEQSDGSKKELACHLEYEIDGNHIEVFTTTETLYENGSKETFAVGIVATLELSGPGTFVGVADIFTRTTVASSAGQQMVLEGACDCVFVLSVSSTVASGCEKYRIALEAETAMVTKGSHTAYNATIEQVADFEDAFTFDISCFDDRVEIDISRNYESVTETETTSSVSISHSKKVVDSGTGKTTLVIKQSNGSYMMDIVDVTKEFYTFNDESITISSGTSTPKSTCF